MELDDVYAANGVDPETQEAKAEAQEPVSTGEESSPPEQVAQQEPEVDWRAEAEKAKRAAEEAERKAKGLEQAVAAARARVREQSQQPAFNEDPIAYAERVRTEVLQEVAAQRIEFSQRAAREKYEDYGEKEQAFIQLAQEMPLLVEQLRTAPDPAEFAYRTAEFHLALKEAGGSVEALRKQIEAQALAQRAEQFQAKAQAIPKTLAGATGTGRKSANTFAGPASLDDIYSRKR